MRNTHTQAHQGNDSERSKTQIPSYFCLYFFPSCFVVCVAMCGAKNAFQLSNYRKTIDVFECKCARATANEAHMIVGVRTSVSANHMCAWPCVCVSENIHKNDKSIRTKCVCHSYVASGDTRAKRKACAHSTLKNVNIFSVLFCCHFAVSFVRCHLHCSYCFHHRRRLRRHFSTTARIKYEVCRMHGWNVVVFFCFWELFKMPLRKHKIARARSR